MDSFIPASALASDGIYPEPPRECPPDLAKPGMQYKSRAWLAMLGLAGFALIYLVLTFWFAWSSYYLLHDHSEELDRGVALVGGICCLLIAIFFIKGLFFKKPSGSAKDFELKREQQPRLFAFLDRLAAETGAPRPHKVFLSPRVNACVFYDLSILNFFFKGRKNLEIGLGLVNCLSVSEFKAVLAHEFGHFAQSTMAVGRWVYMAQQVATQLIFHRDWFDSLLSAVSRVDFRIAWIGWLLRLLIWALRSILDTLLSFVMLAHRALSREMEYQADLVAVTSTGSDALIHALHRLSPADEAWDETKSFMDTELKRGFVPEDLFAVQSRILEHKRRILNDPSYGLTPKFPEADRESNRVFTPDLAQPPQMWSTHPANHLREQNAKKCYVFCEFNEEHAWALFDQPEQLRKDFTKHLFEGAEKPACPLEETLQQLEKTYSRHCLNPDYRGVYLDRSVVSHHASPQEMYLSTPPLSSELYPATLTEVLEKHRNLRKEHALLKALHEGHFEPVDGIIRFRGDVIKRRQISAALETVKAELDASDAILSEHDKKCRTYHLALAKDQGRGWPLYLEAQLELLHFAEHSLRDLHDAYLLFNNTLRIVLADGSVSKKERERVISDGNVIWWALNRIYKYRDEVQIDAETARHMEHEKWSDYLEEFVFQNPVPSNLQSWVNVLPGWVMQASHALSELRSAALESLLDTEKKLSRAALEGYRLPPAPATPKVPYKYEVLLPGQERDLQSKLNFWSRFQTASGIVPATLRFMVAGGIVCMAVWITFSDSSIMELRELLGI